MVAVTERKASRERLLIVVSVSISVLFMFGIAEAGLRLASNAGVYIPKVEEPYVERHYYLGKWLKPGAEYHNQRASLSVNSRGFRGDEFDVPKPAGTYRIFSLGGSTTFGYFPSITANEFTYPGQLQTLLNQHKPDPQVNRYEVINAGVPGYSVRTSLMNFASRILYYQPDMIVIYHNTNDLARYGDERELLYPLDKMADRRSNLTLIAQGLFGWSYFLTELEYSISERLMPMLTAKFSSSAAAQKSMTDAAVSQQHTTQENGLPAGGSAERKAEWQEDTRYADAFHRDLSDLVAIAKQQGVRVVMVSQSITLSASTDFAHLTADEIAVQMDKPDPYHAGIPPAYRYQMFSRYNDIIHQVASEQGVLYVDAASVIPKTPEYHWDYCHLTNKGAALLAATIHKGLLAAAASADVAPELSPNMQENAGATIDGGVNSYD